jgi:hypothetical protein
LDNKDRLGDPGEVITEFTYRPLNSMLPYMIRMVEYPKAPEGEQLKLTVHRMEDTTDCDKLTFKHRAEEIKLDQQ